MKSNRLLYAVLAIQAGIVAYLLLQPKEPMAMAQIPDQGAQMQQLIDQTKSLNAKLDRVVAVLEGGKLQVTVKASDEKSGR